MLRSALSMHFYTDILHNFRAENSVYHFFYRQGNTAAHSARSCSILSIDFSFVDVVANGGGFQDGAVGGRLAYPWLPACIQTWLGCCFLSPFLASHHPIFSTKSQNRLLCCIRNPLPASWNEFFFVARLLPFPPLSCPGRPFLKAAVPIR